MKSFFRRITISVFIQLIIVCTAFPQNIRFNKVSFPEDFINTITGITQDKQGNIWFSAGGIARYDGVQLKIFKHDPLNPNSISVNFIECILADKKGYIWAGSYGGGLNKLDPTTGIFTHYRHDAKNPNSIIDDTITCILEDKDGMIWIGTQRGGLDRFDPATGQFEHFRHNDNDPGSLSFDQVRVIYEDKRGDLWIGCGGPFRENQPGVDGGLNRFDRKTGKFISYKHHPKDLHSLIDNRVRAIFEDSRGVFWVGTAGDGLHTMNRETGTFERHNYDPFHPDKLSRPPVNKSITFADDHITFINEDRKGFIWIGTFAAGISRFDPLSKSITRYTTHENSYDNSTDSTTWWSFISRDGVLWISSFFTDLFRVEPSHQDIHYTLISSGGRVFDFLKSPGLGLYLATQNGLILMDNNNKEIKSYVHDPQNPGSISDNEVWTIYRDKKNRIWTGSTGKSGGLNLFNPLTETFTLYQPDPKHSKRNGYNSIYRIYEDRQANLWVGTPFGIGKMNDKGEFTKYLPFPEDTVVYGRNFVMSILEDSRQNLWVGTESGGGLHILDRKTGKFAHYLNRRRVYQLFEDNDGKLWAGAEDGLYFYNAGLDSFTVFKDPSTGNSFSAWGIQEDANKNLWVSSAGGLYKINHDRLGISRFGKSFGINSARFSGLGIYEADDGQFFIAIGGGYYALYPDKITSNPTPPEIVFTDFQLANNPLVSGNETSLIDSLEAGKQLNLSHDQDAFTFHFNIIHYSNPDANKAIYILENYDLQWRSAGSERIAYYNNIPPGRYRFRIKAASSYGVWTEKSIDVIITPPWWQRWWAYILYGLLAIGIVLTIHRTLKQRVINAERERTRTRELAQAKEIEKAYHELKTTQSQLIQSEKMASLGELTAGIAHEIQNPLNFVNNFSELNTELIDEMQQEMEKGNYNDAKVISDNIKQNEQKINYQGKRADAIVKSMLQHSRTSNEQKEPTDLNALADEYLRLAYHGLRAKDKNFNANLVTDFDPGIGKVNVIPQDIGRVLLNLYNNAFYALSAVAQAKADGGYKPTVTVSTKLMKTQGDGGTESAIRNPQFAIVVKDNGMGIPDKVKAKIFQPFFTTKPTGQGTGLGLSLSYDIIKAHGGEIKVDSKDGEYTEFTILLPV